MVFWFRVLWLAAGVCGIYDLPICVGWWLLLYRIVVVVDWIWFVAGVVPCMVVRFWFSGLRVLGLLVTLCAGWAVMNVAWIWALCLWVWVG